MLINIVQSNVSFNGFISAGFAGTSLDAPYLIPGHDAISKNPNAMALTLLGLQMSMSFNHKFSAVAQLVANGDNKNGKLPKAAIKNQAKTQGFLAISRFPPNHATLEHPYRTTQHLKLIKLR